jgi:hypothetical protein
METCNNYGWCDSSVAEWRCAYLAYTSNTPVGRIRLSRRHAEKLPGGVVQLNDISKVRFTRISPGTNIVQCRLRQRRNILFTYANIA